MSLTRRGHGRTLYVILPHDVASIDFDLCATQAIRDWIEGWEWKRFEAMSRGEDAEKALCDSYLTTLRTELHRRERLARLPGAPTFPTDSAWDPDRFTRIKDRVRIEDYAERFLLMQRVRRHRNSIWCCCPLPGHQEATPSFRINLDRQRFYCFGCRRFGDVIDLVLHVHGCAHVTQAAELLESLYDIAPPKPVTATPVVRRADGSYVTIKE